MRKKFMFMFVLSLMMLIFSATSFAAESGMCGENATWTFENGVLTISGTGEVVKTDAWWEMEDIEKIVVEDGITSIGHSCFKGLPAKAISLPNTLTTINSHAFVFSGIETLDIPDSVKQITGIYVISDSVVNLRIGSGLETLDDGAIRFNIGSAMENIEVSEDNQYFSAMDGALFDKDKTKLILCAAAYDREIYKIPDTVKVIGHGAFARCNGLKNIVIPEGVTEIGDNAFSVCYRLDRLYLPNSVTVIGAGSLDRSSVGEHTKFIYNGTKEEFEKIRIVGKTGYPYGSVIDAELPEDCVEIVYSPEIKVWVDGMQIDFDVPPQIINDRTMIPLRAVFEALGAEVEWDEATQTVTAQKIWSDSDSGGRLFVKFKIGSHTMENSFAPGIHTIDSPPVIVDGRTLIPVRAVAEAFGFDVEWNGDTKEVIITGK